MFVAFIILMFLSKDVFSQAKITEEEAPVAEFSQETKTTDTKINKFKDIVITSSYGAFAGAVTGLAMLAFVSRPQDKLRYITIGASLGLYAGTLLGLYFAFGVGLPKQEVEDPYLREFEGFGYTRGNLNYAIKDFDHNKIYLDNNTNFKFTMPILLYNF